MISIIVPVYNAEKWIDRCIKSLIKQTYDDIEIILVNDGSTDTSLSVCKKYADIDKRIVVIDKKNSGVSATRNIGIEIAKGEYIQFVDSDDYIDEKMCEMLVNAIENVDMAMCGMRIWRNGVVLREPHLDNGIYTLKDNIDIYFKLRKINLGPCNKLYRKELIKNNFIDNVSLGEDTIFVLDYMRNVEKISNISECLYNVVLDNNSSLNRNKPDGYVDLLIEQRKKEEHFLTEMYGTDCDMTQMYNQYLLNMHAYFIQSPLTTKMISTYTDDEFLISKIRKANPQRFDYKLFKNLFINKHVIALRLFFYIKDLIYGVKYGKK